MTMDAQRARGYELEKIKGGLFEQVRKLGPLMVPVTIHAIIGSEDIIDAMDLPRLWRGSAYLADQLTYHRRDFILIAFGVLILLASLAVGFMGYGNFWFRPLDQAGWRLKKKRRSLLKVTVFFFIYKVPNTFRQLR